MKTVLFYTVTLGFVLGVLVRSFVDVSHSAVFLLLLMAGGLFVLWWRTKTYQSTKKPLRWSLTLLLAMSIGLVACTVGVVRMDSAKDAMVKRIAAVAVGETKVTGRVIREPDVREGMTMLTVATEDTRVLLRVDRYSDIRYGDTIEVSGELERPESFVTDLGREFDYPGYLEARGITHTMSFVTPAIIERDESSLLARLYQVKQYFLQRLALVLPDPAYGLGAGLLLGAQAALGEELMADFRAAGIVHMVVLSGYNIMLVVTFVLVVTAFFLPFRLRLLVAGGAIIVFALLVGYSPSVMRATAMALLFLLTALLARPYDILRVLVLAGTLMIVMNPYILLFDIGFQLSFMATLGLVLIAPQFERLFAKVTTWFGAKTFLVATIATQIAVLPLILYHIGEWSLVAIPVNLLTLPMVPVAMLATFLAGLVALISTMLALPLALLAQLSLLYIIGIATFAAKLPIATVTVPAFSGYLLPVAYLLLGMAWYWWYRYQAKRGEPDARLTKSEQEELAHWEIVEEGDYLKTLAAADKTKRVADMPAARSETSIFFR